MCFRCGWVTRNIHSAFDYIYNSASKDRTCGKVLSNWLRSVNGEIVGGYPPTAEDIQTEEEKLFKFTKNLFSHQVHVTNKDLKKLMIGSILRWEDDVIRCISSDPLKSYVHDITAHMYIAEIEKVKKQTGKSFLKFQYYVFNYKKKFLL